MTAHQMIEQIQQFYQRETSLVTSPFITQLGEVNIDLLSKVFDALELDWEQGVVADLGCGTGLLSSFMTPAKFYVGMDIVSQSTLPDLIDEHRHFIRADAHCIPLANESVDVLLCVDSFEHYPDPLQAAGEFYRILKPDGALFLSVPNYANVAGLVKKAMEKWGGYARDTWAPFDCWKPEELEHYMTAGRIRRLFSAVGFRIFRLQGFEDEVAVGLCPWIWHPKMPGKIEKIIKFFFRGVAKELVRIWPSTSLHNFWKIKKM